jgi:hypothetical protein
VIKNILSSLNGWQRIFIFITLLIYLPIFLGALTDVQSEYEYKYSDYEINQKVSDYIKKEKIQITVEIKKQNQFDKFDYKKAPLAELSSSIKNKDLLIFSEFNSTDNKQKYTAIFAYLKDKKDFNNDPETLKIAKFIQGVIDKNEMQNRTYIKYLELFAYFSLAIFLTYFVGFMIGWVIKGFKQVKG